MLSTIKDILYSIGNFFTSIYDFVISLFEDLVFVVKATSKAVASIPNLFSWLPAPVLALLVAIFAVVVIYKIMGREG